MESLHCPFKAEHQAETLLNIYSAAIKMNPKIRTEVSNLFVLWAMPGPPRFQWATIFPADQKQRSPPENLAFYSRLNGDNQKKKKKKVFA